MSRLRTLREGEIVSSEADISALEGRFNPVVLREAVIMYRANQRVGTASTKTRAEINGSTKKIYKQKHTGRARHGDRKAPIFRGGGVAHGPHPRDYSYSMPRKALRRALRIALAGKFRDDEVVRWEGDVIAGDKPSTRTIVRGLFALSDEAEASEHRHGSGENALFVGVGPLPKQLLLSVRNLRRVKALPAAEVTAHDLVAHRFLVLLDGALDVLLARAGISADHEPKRTADGTPEEQSS